MKSLILLLLVFLCGVTFTKSMALNRKDKQQIDSKKRLILRGLKKRYSYASSSDQKITENSTCEGNCMESTEAYENDVHRKCRCDSACLGYGDCCKDFFVCCDPENAEPNNVCGPNECDSNPCRNNGTCIDKSKSFSCVCTEGWEGELCEIDINECIKNGCQNGATCYDKENGYFCDCPPGWEGDKCELDIDDCANEPCLHGSTCVDGINGFTCICASGWTGDNCCEEAAEITSLKDTSSEGFIWDDFFSDVIAGGLAWEDFFSDDKVEVTTWGTTTPEVETGVP